MVFDRTHLPLLAEREASLRTRVDDLKDKVSFLGNGQHAPKFRKLLKEAQSDLRLVQQTITAVRQR